MVEVASAIDRLAVSVTRTREAPGYWDQNGNWVPGAPSSSSIWAAVQPASGRQLEDLPEGMRASARWLCWSRSELKLDDQITHMGDTYRIVHLWPRAEGAFYRAAMGLLA